MDWSDSESESEAIETAEPQDLFCDEADKSMPDPIEDEAEEVSVRQKEEEPKNKVRKKPKSKKIQSSKGICYKTLTKPSGLPALIKLFKNFKFKGTGHEEEDLTRIMAILQRWMCYQLCPSYDFETCMNELEAVGKKRIVQTLMKKYRMGIEDWGEKNPDGVEQDKQDDEIEINEPAKENDFDQLLNEEIANANSDCEWSPHKEETQQSTHTETEVDLTPEQLERIARNRKLAEERKMKRMTQQQLTVNKQSTSANNSEILPMELDYI